MNVQYLFRLFYVMLLHTSILSFFILSNKKADSVPDGYFIEGAAVSIIDLSKNLLKHVPERSVLLRILSHLDRY